VATAPLTYRPRDRAAGHHHREEDHVPPYWNVAPKSIKVRRDALERERARLLAQQQTYAQIEAQRVQRIVAAGPELAAALAAQEEVNERVARAQAAFGEDPGGMGGLLREQRMQERLDDITDELAELAT